MCTDEFFLSFISISNNMFGHRFLFALLPVMFVLVSSAPLPLLDVQLLPMQLGELLTNETLLATESLVYDDENNSKESKEDDLQTTTTTDLPELVTDILVVKENQTLSMNIDEILDLADRLLDEFPKELPSTPTTENPFEDTDDD